MPDFQRKQIPFLHKGQVWNAAPEKLPDGSPMWAKNVRVLQQGTISAAHGYTEVYGPVAGVDVLHSMSRLNILSEQTTEGQPAFDPALSRTYVMGADQKLFVFQDQASMDNASLNPVDTPNGLNGFSGNPLSIVDMQPAGAAVPWKYIGDSAQMVGVGYYPAAPDNTGVTQPADKQGTTMARCLTMGMDVPVINSGPPAQSASTTPGSLTVGGQYQWCFAFRHLITGARSNPSCATRVTAATPPLTISSNAAFGQAANLFTPDVPKDPQTGNPDTHIVVDIYRFGGNINRWALVGTSQGAVNFTDTASDESLLAAPAPPQTTDASTGLTRFNLFRPFVTADIECGGGATTYQQGPGLPMYLDSTSTGSVFNTEWLAGSTIFVGGQAYTIYQVISPTKLELAGDVTVALATGQSINWTIPAGTLMAGQPLPHIWGPYGVGQGGSYIFGCGDPNARGTLYWTNGNDPDSTDIVNNIIVTSPSEKLVTGCIYSGQPYCWSTERQFQVFPSLTIFGQFTTSEVPGAKGCWLEWSLSVQSNGFSDQSVSWRGKDGIYDMSASNGLQRLTDPLYAFFPHDNEPGIAPETIMPQIGSYSQRPEHVGNLDDTRPQFHRLTWFQGMLFYDFVGLGQNPPGTQVSIYSTLVWDTVQIPGGGWVSLDQPFATTGAPVCRCVEVGANDPVYDNQIEAGPSGTIYGAMSRGGSMKVLRSEDPTGSGTAPFVYDYYGVTRGFPARVFTKAEDIGDSRAPKLWGDFWLDATPINPITVYPVGDFSLSPLLPSTAAAGTLPGPPDQRTQYIMDFQEFVNPSIQGQGLLTTTLALDINWTAADGPYTETLYQWQPSWVPKPEFIEFRATDPNDAGQVQAKYLMGANIEANTQGELCQVRVIIDNQTAGTLQMNHATQSEKPYAWTPIAGYEFQVQLVVGPAENALQLFKINWIFEPWPDAVARTYPFMDYGEVGAKFIQGVVMPIETNGQTATIGLFSDDDNKLRTWQKSTQPLVKTGTTFDISEPFIAHELQWSTLTPHRIWPGEAKVVWEPAPELTETWQTQQGSWEFPAWWSLRECYIAYMGGSGTPMLTITTEYGDMQYALDPAASNQYIRSYRVLAPQKSKWKAFRVDCAGGIRLYQKDCCVFAKGWGSTGPYVVLHPFGGQSRTSGAAI